jgi:hypothetical protein
LSLRASFTQLKYLVVQFFVIISLLNYAIWRNYEFSIVQPGKTEGGSGSRFNEGGAKKLLIIAMVQHVPERYENLRIQLNLLLHLEEAAFCGSADMKLANALLGLQRSSSNHQCPRAEAEFSSQRPAFSVPRQPVQLERVRPTARWS